MTKMNFWLLAVYLENNSSISWKVVSIGLVKQTNRLSHFRENQALRNYFSFKTEPK